MPVPPHPLPDSLGDAFSTVEALAAGATSGRLRAKDLEQPFDGVRCRPEPAATDEDESLSRLQLARRSEARSARAYSTVMTSHAFFAGRTAALLQGATIDQGTQLDVGVFAPERAPRRTGVRGIKVAPKLVHVHTYDGMRMTTPASSWAMLGAELSVRELVALGDSIVRIPRDERGVLMPDERLATVAQLERAVGAGRRVGVAKLREALPLIRVGSASPLETEYRLAAAEGGLPEPELDVEIRTARGRLLGISEVVYRQSRTVVEIEGDHHRTDRKQWNRDIDKYAAYTAEGWEVVRLTSLHIRGKHARAVGIVRSVLLRRGWSAS